MKKHPLRRWRESHDETVTLTQLAEKVGTGKSTLSEIEGWKRRPTLALACRLAELTQIPVPVFNSEASE